MDGFSLTDWLGPASTLKGFESGTHRVIDPAQTVERVSKYFPLAGITRVADVTGLDRVGIPVVVVSRPNARSVAISQGKGATLDAAKASGVMESLETYVAEKITLPLKLASKDDLAWSHELINLDALPRVKGVQPADHTMLLWIEGMDVMSGRHVWMPYETVHTNYARPMPPGSGRFMSSSNGLASGNTKAEAMSHAICETVERDAIAVWSWSPETVRDSRRVRNASVNDPVCARLMQAFDAADIDVAIWDVTSDIGVPTALVWIMERGNIPVILPRVSVGAGCHPDPRVALSRALTEAAQERLTLIAGARDDLSRNSYAPTDFSEVFRRPGQMEFSAPEGPVSRLDEDVNDLLGKLRSVGIEEVACVDLSLAYMPEVAVMRVVIPGLESAVDDHRHVPGARAQRARAA